MNNRESSPLFARTLENANRAVLLVLLSLSMLFLPDTLSAQAPPPKALVFISPIGGPAPPATGSSVFKTPVGVAMGADSTASSTTIFVADPFNNQVVAFPPGGATVTFSALPCPAT